MEKKHHHRVKFSLEEDPKRFVLSVHHLDTGFGLMGHMTLEEGVAFYNVVLEQLRKIANNPEVLPLPLVILGAEKEKESVDNVIQFRSPKADDGSEKD